MVEAVLHNACLRMEDWGSSLDDVMRAKTRKRWFGRSGLVVGGAASLAVGAVLGGVLEGVPVLFPPSTGAVSLPHVTSDSAGSTAKQSVGLAGFNQIPASAQTPTEPLAPGAGQASQALQAASSQARSPASADSAAGGSGAATSGQASGSGASSGAGSGVAGGSGGGSVGATGTPGSSTPSLPLPVPAPQVQGSLGQVLNTLSGAASSLPVVGQTASSTLGAAGAAAEQATGAASSAASSGTRSVAPVTSTTTPVSSASSPLPGITSGASSSLGGL